MDLGVQFKHASQDVIYMLLNKRVRVDVHVVPLCSHAYRLEWVLTERGLAFAHALNCGTGCTLVILGRDITITVTLMVAMNRA